MQDTKDRDSEAKQVWVTPEIHHLTVSSTEAGLEVTRMTENINYIMS